MRRKPRPHSETAFIPMNDGRLSLRRDKSPYFAVAWLAHTARDARAMVRTNTTDWRELKKQGWRVVKVRISVMTAGQIKAAKGTRR